MIRLLRAYARRQTARIERWASRKALDYAQESGKPVTVLYQVYEFARWAEQEEADAIAELHYARVGV